MMNRKADIYIDGASKGNPGDASYGAVIRLPDREIHLAGRLGTMTNNEAEYHGLLAALRWADQNQIERLTIFSDSQLLVKQITGKYRVKAKNLQTLFLKAVELSRKFQSFRIFFITREYNQKADRLANLALKKKWPAGKEIHEHS